MNNETLFNKKISILMILGSKYSLSSLKDEQYLYKFDHDLLGKFGHIWNEKWEREFPTDKEKILLLKGVILLEKIYEKNEVSELIMGSATITSTVFKRVEEKKLLNQRLFDWIIQNRSSNKYTPFGYMKYSHIEDYAEYLEFIEIEKSHRETHYLNRARKEIKILNKAKDHKIKEELTKNRNKLKRKIVKDYFRKNRCGWFYGIFKKDNKFLNDIISNELPFPLDLTPKEEIYAAIPKTKKLSKSELEMLIARIPRKSAGHIKEFKKLLVKQLNSRSI